MPNLPKLDLEGKIVSEDIDVAGRNVKYVTVHESEKGLFFIPSTGDSFQTVTEIITDKGSASDIVLDITNMHYIGMDYLHPINFSVLVDVYEHIKVNQGTMKLIVPEDNIRMNQELRRMNFDKMFDIYTSREEALDSYR